MPVFLSSLLPPHKNVYSVELQVLVYDPDNVEAILARCKASRAAGRKVEALAHLESGRKQAL